MRKVLFCSIRFLLVIIIVSFSSYKVNADEIEVVLQELKVLQNDIKTLEKAVYNQDIVSSSSTVAGSENNNDVLEYGQINSGFKLITDYLDKSILRPNNISHPKSRIDF